MSSWLHLCHEKGDAKIVRYSSRISHSTPDRNVIYSRSICLPYSSSPFITIVIRAFPSWLVVGRLLRSLPSLKRCLTRNTSLDKNHYFLFVKHQALLL